MADSIAPQSAWAVRARTWDPKETQILLQKWGQPDIQERLKAYTKKRPIWEEISVFVRAEGYEDRDYIDYAQCQTRMKTLISAYRRFIDGQRKTGMNKAKKPFRFDTLDSIIGGKPTSRPSNLVSSLPLQLGSESWLSPNSPTSAYLGLDENKEQESKKLYEDDSAFAVWHE